MKYIMIAILLCGCTPLRHVRVSEKVDSVVVDRTVVAVRDSAVRVVDQLMMQTIIEYYPIFDTIYVERSTDAIGSIKQPIKTITQTTIETRVKEEQTRDSVRQNDFVIDLSRTTDFKTRDRLSAAAQTAVWIAVALAAALIILIILKFR